MRHVLLIAMTCLLFMSCHDRHSSSSIKQLFENAHRSDPRPQELGYFVKLLDLQAGKQCAAFFVQNSGNRILLSSATHCFDFNAKAWCEKGGRFIDNRGQMGRCKAVHIAAPDRDIMLFEADDYTLGQSFPLLRLADYVPPLHTRLRMLGYPSDSFRASQPTVTYNCWVTSETVPSPFASSEMATRDTASQHNCSTYSGNSGGPMLAEGTLDVIGQPATYADGDLAMRESASLSQAAHLSQMTDFVAHHRRKLSELGVALSKGHSSTQRSAWPEEARSIVQLDNGCTAFFIENEDKRILLGSSTQCLAQPEEWCRSGGTFTDNKGQLGVCETVLVGSAHTKLVIFSADDAYQQHGESALPLRLASYVPLPQSPLVMLGFSSGSPAATDNCWLISPIEHALSKDSKLKKQDLFMQHNCSIMQGYEGSPMLIMGSKDIIGLPSPFDKTRFTMEDTSPPVVAYLTQMASFVTRFRQSIDLLKITVATHPPDPSLQDLQMKDEDMDSFQTYCEKRNKLERETRKTIDVLLSYVKTRDCELAAIHLAQMSEIVLFAKGIVDLSPFQQAIFRKNLRALYLEKNSIVDPSPLAALQKLKYINLNGNRVKDLSSLSALPELEELHLRRNGISDLTSFAQLARLGLLDLSENAISDPSPLKKIAGLHSLLFDENKGDNSQLLSGLGDFGRRKLLSLNGLDLEDIQAFSSGRLLIRDVLRLSRNRIEDISPLALDAFGELKELHLAENEIIDVKALKGLTKIQRLDLSGNRIQSIKDLAGLSDLRALDLEDNLIEDWFPLRDMERLTDLWFARNPVNFEFCPPRVVCH